MLQEIEKKASSSTSPYYLHLISSKLEFMCQITEPAPNLAFSKHTIDKEMLSKLYTQLEMQQKRYKRKKKHLKKETES
eukprot:GAHX01002047.1.p1 GENE.GAHX01002047.1~~GAHX01002047.1.p1  ORF type:complete len:78 (-),score=17.28 GAHX01002047.1:676-909(-)